MPSPRKTNREVEVKIRIANADVMRRALENVGAVLHRRVLEQNTLYDTADWQVRRSGRVLRVRIETPVTLTRRADGSKRAILTSKAPVRRPAATKSLSRYKERLEREQIVAEPNDLIQKMKALGFHPRFRYEKYRTTYYLPGLHVELDETPVGTYLELEGTPTAIESGARRLGFTAADYRKETYWGVYVAACKRRGVRPTNMLFR